MPRIVVRGGATADGPRGGDRNRPPSYVDEPAQDITDALDAIAAVGFVVGAIGAVLLGHDVPSVSLRTAPRSGRVGPKGVADDLAAV